MTEGEGRKVLVVTGGSRGIGAATAVKAAARGYDVVVNYAGNAAAADSVVKRCENAGARALAVQGDMAKPEDIERLFDAAVEAFGRIDAVVNNAGVTGLISPLADSDPNEIRRTVDLNVTGLILCTRAAVRRMAKSRGGAGGAIVNLSSIAAVLGAPGELTWYAASKGAVDSFTIGIARELARDGVRVNAVAPGLIDTEIHAAAGAPDRAQRLMGAVPMGRTGTAEEVADPILYLMSDEASYITGAILQVTGGR